MLRILSDLMILHVVIGIYYAITTQYNVTKMFKEKSLLYLQIFSAFAAWIVISALFKPYHGIAVHSGIFLIIAVLVAAIASFHIANGFFNGCITLGISISPQTKFAVKILSWIIAVFSMLEIIILLV